MNYLIFFLGIFLLIIGIVTANSEDGSQVPRDCLTSHADDYLREHEFNCTRFWKCLPFADGELANYELFECAACGPDCSLSFNIQTGECDWDYNVDCETKLPASTTPTTPTPASTTPATTPTPTTPSTTTTPVTNKPSTMTSETTDYNTTTPVTTPVEDQFCSTSDECTARCGGDCCNGQCKYSECCDDSECENGVCHPLSGMCVECHQNADCSSDSGCSGTCIDSMCAYPECCTDQDCPVNNKCDLNAFICRFACENQSNCNNWNNLCSKDRYENCQYCSNSTNSGLCHLGCGQDANCPSLYTPHCNMEKHQCGCWSDEQCKKRSSRNHKCDLLSNTCVMDEAA